MYKTTYVCDCCGKEMQSPMYTLELKTNSLCIQDRAGWHYCNDCWGYIKKSLVKKNELSDLEKTVKELKEENEKLKKDANWCEQLFIPIFTAFMNNYYKDTGCGFTTTTTTSDEEKIIQGKPIINDEFTHSSPYTSYTISTNGEKTVQAKPAGDGPFTVGCCCENTNKDSLEYKQVTEI